MSRYNQFVDAILGSLTASAGNVPQDMYMLIPGSPSGLSPVFAS